MTKKRKLEPCRNPESGELRCPINGFQDCVREKCFFWMRGERAETFIKSVIGTPDKKMEERWEDTCLLLLFSVTLSPAILLYLSDIRDEAFFDSMRVPATSLEDRGISWPNAVRQRLERIEKLLLELSRRGKVVDIRGKEKR